MKTLKEFGTVIDGVRMSATKDDQNGLTALFVFYSMSPTTFPNTVFEFSNGTKYTVTKDNIGILTTEWATFRRSFFDE